MDSRARQQQQPDVSASSPSSRIQKSGSSSGSGSGSGSVPGPEKLQLQVPNQNSDQNSSQRVDGNRSGSQSLQAQLAHLYQHHQQHSPHSPYIDFQNLLFSQNSNLNHNHHHHYSHNHNNHGLLCSSSMDPYSPVSPMTMHQSPLLDKSRRRSSVLTMGEALEPILATSPVQAKTRLDPSLSLDLRRQQQGPPVTGPILTGLASNSQSHGHINSRKRRDSIPSLPLHLDMDMQLDSVVPGPSGVAGGGGGGGSSSSGSTLTEFTKRRNWSQRIIEELQDLLCILTPSGKIRYTSPNTKNITGFSTEELLGRMITDFVHTDDSHIFIREFNESIASTQPLRLFFRFRRKDDSYAIFESNGHPHFSDHRQLPSNTTTPVCSGFFMMARLYPTKNVALLDSFLEHKIENERLKRRIAELRLEEQEEQAAQTRARNEAAAAVAAALAAEGSAENNNPATVVGALASNQSSSMPPPAMPTQLTRQNLEGLNNSALRSDSLRDKMARYEGVTHADTIEMLTGLRYNEGERSRGISTGDTSPSLIRGDAGVPLSADRESRGSGERKKKVKITNEYVCTDCGTLDSPEWRKGPTGPKTLCNACGLRWAKLSPSKPPTWSAY
ncbi:blue light receptor, variant 2 [Orbilia blumenaviensis]|uniref:Blue light receptor, variant 2 n=1 Tax=Orbilia blumenaviensis TaxID=1796055 RepID=A0AAV9UG24_9PEZI